MEPQPTEFAQTSPTSSGRDDYSPDDNSLPTTEQQLSASFPILRFPRPQVSQHLANWVSHSSPDIMQPSNMSDTSSLADSAYEIVHGTDSESQDGRLTESIGSLSAPRPEDVQSLDGSENHYNTDSEQEQEQEMGHSSHASSIRYADQALQNPSTQLPATSLECGSSTECSGVVVGSIELQETPGGESAVLEKVAAKHAICEFTEEESAVVAHQLNLPDAPKRLVASIRQTMSPSYLSTQEPLRLLYVGQADAQRSIVLKICSAIWASPKGGSTDDQDHFSRHREGVYNIVPISSFGPAPELDLMEASHYQIKVEHCTSATSSPDGVSVTVDHDKLYTSSASSNGLVIHPKWDLPHVAIFYCSKRDDAEAQLTRDAAWSFMNRHGVSCIMIAEQQSFKDTTTVPWGAYIAEDTVHLCLESRDPDRPMTPRRLPIDFASFAEIDSRQMNRHLAYLTGLSDKEDATLELDIATTEALLKPQSWEPKILVKAKKACDKLAERYDLRRWAQALVGPLLLSLTVPFLVAVFAGWLRTGGNTHLQSTSSTGVCVSPPNYPDGFTTTKRASVTTSTKTVVVNVTSTTTVQVSQARQPSTSALASALSFAGFLSDKPSAAPTDAEAQKKPAAADASKKTTLCTVSVFSPTEILVALPSRNKAVWLAQGAIDIDVRRSDAHVPVKLASVDEGVLVELPPREAHGVLNVSVVTTRRPKINETFQVDFGQTAVTQLVEAGLHAWQNAVDRLARASTGGASQLIEHAAKLEKEVLATLEHASENVRSRAADSVQRTAETVRARLARHAASADNLRREVDLSVLQAQIASRLWWLSALGRTDEHRAYARNASRLLKAKHDELAARGGAGRSRRKAEGSEPKEACSGLRAASSYWRCWRSGGRAGRVGERVEAAAKRRDGRWGGAGWRKLMGREE